MDNPTEAETGPLIGLVSMVMVVLVISMMLLSDFPHVVQVYTQLRHSYSHMAKYMKK